MNILAIIPARGGSKGIPMKNIRNLVGKPLIEHTISQAKHSRKINRIIVSTDNKEIAHLAKSLGVEVPYIRPKKLARDNSPTIDSIRHALKFLYDNESYVPDIILILQPTSPLRTVAMIDKSIDMLKRSNATSVVTVKKIKEHPYNSFWFEKKYMIPFKRNFEKYFQRQLVPNLYHPTGSIYTFWYKTLKNYNSIYGPRIKPFIEENNIDIDSKFDLFLTEMKMRYWKEYSEKHENM